MEDSTVITLIVVIIISFVVGGFIVMLLGNTLHNVTIRTKVLDEVCIQLYGNGTKSYNPNWLAIEEDFKCRKIEVKQEPPLQESKIKFIEEECKRC